MIVFMDSGYFIFSASYKSDLELLLNVIYIEVYMRAQNFRSMDFPLQETNIPAEETDTTNLSLLD